MKRLTLVTPAQNESQDEIVWHNLRIADEIYKLELFISSSMGWFRLNPTKNFRDFELALREKNINTHLYAKKTLPTSGMKLCSPNKSVTDAMEYECIYSCRPKEYALAEVLKFWPTYEENLLALEKSGSLNIIDKKDCDIQKNKEFKKFDNVEQQISEELCNCTKKIMVITRSTEECIDEIFQFSKTKYGKEPDMKVIGLAKTGGPIFGFYIEDNLISNLGLIVQYNKNGEQEKEIIDLSKI